jgi:hypothetical protein
VLVEEFSVAPDVGTGNGGGSVEVGRIGWIVGFVHTDQGVQVQTRGGLESEEACAETELELRVEVGQLFIESPELLDPHGQTDPNAIGQDKTRVLAEICDRRCSLDSAPEPDEVELVGQEAGQQRHHLFAEELHVAPCPISSEREPQPDPVLLHVGRQEREARIIEVDIEFCQFALL